MDSPSPPSFTDCIAPHSYLDSLIRDHPTFRILTIEDSSRLFLSAGWEKHAYLLAFKATTPTYTSVETSYMDTLARINGWIGQYKDEIFYLRSIAIPLYETLMSCSLEEHDVEIIRRINTNDSLIRLFKCTNLPYQKEPPSLLFPLNSC